MSVSFNKPCKSGYVPVCRRASSAIITNFTYVEGQDLAYNDLVGITQLIISGLLTTENVEIGMPSQSTLLQLFKNPVDNQLLSFYVVNATGFQLSDTPASPHSLVLSIPATDSAEGSRVNIAGDTTVLITLQILSTVNPWVSMSAALIGETSGGINGATPVLNQLGCRVPSQYGVENSDTLLMINTLVESVKAITISLSNNTYNRLPAIPNTRSSIKFVNSSTQELKIYVNSLSLVGVTWENGLVQTVAVGESYEIIPKIQSFNDGPYSFTAFPTSDTLLPGFDYRFGTRFIITFDVVNPGNVLCDQYGVHTVPPGLGQTLQDGPHAQCALASSALQFTPIQSSGFNISMKVTPALATAISTVVLSATSSNAVTFANDTVVPKIQTTVCGAYVITMGATG
jgi:hypothetical protein